MQTTPTSGTFKAEQGGYTVLSVLVGASILAMATGVFARGFTSVDRAITDGARLIRVEEQVSRALGSVTAEVRETGSVSSGSELEVADEGRRLVFRKSLGFNGTSTVWSDPIVLQHSGSTLTRTVGDGTTTTLATNVSSLTFALDASGSRLTVSLTGAVEGVTYPASETVVLRN